MKTFNFFSYLGQTNGLCHVLTKPCVKNPVFVGFKDVWEELPTNLQIDFSNKLGSGNFGEVYKGRWRNRCDVAIKTLKINEQDSPGKKELLKKEFLKECDIMKKLRHDRLGKKYSLLNSRLL